MTPKILFSAISFSIISLVLSREDIWNDIACDEEYQPSNCDSQKSHLVTIEDYERCGPATLPLYARNYFLGAAGRRITYKRNKDVFDEIQIVPRMLRDVSKNSLETSTLGLDVDFPIGLSPTALQKLAHPDGELATVAGAAPFRTIMILSNFASTLLEEVGDAAGNTNIHLWLQVYIFENRTWDTTLIRRAESSGFKGIVVTVDSPVFATLSCDGWNQIFEHTDIVEPQNIDSSLALYSASASFRDITRLKSITRLPIILKGILSGADAVKGILAGASAILVSNHGGRKMDGTPATIEVLPEVVDAVNKLIPRRDVYMEGGIRSGHDVYKAIARGAKMVFIGRPQIWGLALEILKPQRNNQLDPKKLKSHKVGNHSVFDSNDLWILICGFYDLRNLGSKGVNNVLTILRNEFNETMLLAGASNVNEIRRDTLIPPNPHWGKNSGI